MTFHSLLPDVNALLDLEPEELAGVLLEYLHNERSNSGRLHRGNFLDSPSIVDGYPDAQHDDVRMALMEAWMWLEREGLLVPRPGSNGTHGWFEISRRGRNLTTSDNVTAYRHANRLPRGLLHARIGHKVWGSFLRGDYDTAVFQAFKEVEVAVRTAAQLPIELIGVNLMRKAFAPADGPLTDDDAVPAERQARVELFCGAIGSYKNPQSHRHVNSSSDETVELLLLASHLLRLVDERGSETLVNPAVGS